MQKMYKYEYAHGDNEPFLIADITITVDGPDEIVRGAMALVVDALAPFALRTCKECETATPCECGQEEPTTFAAALYETGQTLWEA